MKAALHRSIIFWSGILVMAFIGWAWRDSMRRESWYARSSAVSDVLRAANGHGGLSLFQSTQPPLNWACTEVAGGEWQRAALDPSESGEIRALPAPTFLRGGNGSFEDQFRDAQLFRPASYGEAIEAMMRYQPPDARLIFLPHWLILLGFALPWSALLLWRARRRQPATALQGAS